MYLSSAQLYHDNVLTEHNASDSLILYIKEHQELHALAIAPATACSPNFQTLSTPMPFFCPIFDFGGIFQGLDINFEFSTPKKAHPCVRPRRLSHRA